jgi:hypothetical protein
LNKKLTLQRHLRLRCETCPETPTVRIVTVLDIYAQTCPWGILILENCKYAIAGMPK